MVRWWGPPDRWAVVSIDVTNQPIFQLTKSQLCIPGFDLFTSTNLWIWAKSQINPFFYAQISRCFLYVSKIQFCCFLLGLIINSYTKKSFQLITDMNCFLWFLFCSSFIASTGVPASAIFSSKHQNYYGLRFLLSEICFKRDKKISTIECGAMTLNLSVWIFYAACFHLKYIILYCTRLAWIKDDLTFEATNKCRICWRFQFVPYRVDCMQFLPMLLKDWILISNRHILIWL